MRIAFIVDTFPCISETFILNQITGLIDMGHEVLIFTGKRSDIAKIPIEVQNYRLMEKTFCINEKPERLLSRYSRAFLLGLKKTGLLIRTLNVFKYGKEALSLNVFYKAFNFKKRGNFDIVQCHFGINGNIGALLKELGFNFKLVTMFHGYDIRKGLSQGKDIYSNLCKNGDCFLSISNYNYNSLIDLGFDKDRIVYHPVGIDISKIGFSFKRAGDDKKDKVKILTVARLVEEKGLEYGIRAFYLLKQQFPDMSLEYTIAGDGPLLNKLKELDQNLGITSNIKFAGVCSHQEVIGLLERAHIFLLPSISEALPISLLEAQAAGLPVVASNVGSVFQALVDGESGYMTKAKDSNDIFLKMKKLIQNPENWEQMATNGRIFVEENYDIKKLNAKLELIYKKLLKK